LRRRERSMTRYGTAVAATLLSLSAFVPSARAAEWLFGVEKVSLSASLHDVKDNYGDQMVRHGWSAVTVDWTPNPILDIHMALGGITSTLEDDNTAMSSQDDQYVNYFSVGVGLDQELDTGGAILIDLTFSTGSVVWDDSAAGAAPVTDWTYDHTRTIFSVAYAFLEPGKARPFVGIAYNTYEAKLRGDDGGDLKGDFEYDTRLNLVGGIYSRTETVHGMMEVVLGGELAVKLGLEFGF
jgi:hypothetical protein